MLDSIPTIEQVAAFIANEVVPDGFTAEQMSQFALIDVFGRVAIVPNAHGTEFPISILEEEGEHAALAGRFTVFDGAGGFSIVKRGVTDRVFQKSPQAPHDVAVVVNVGEYGPWASDKAETTVERMISASCIANGFYQVYGLVEAETDPFDAEELKTLTRISKWYENFEWERRGV